MTLPRWDDLDDAARARVAKFAAIGDTWDDCVSSVGRWFGIGPMATNDLSDGVGYGAAADFDRAYRHATVKSAALAGALSAYQKNMQRVDAMFTLPLALIFWVSRTTRLACVAANELNLPIADALSSDLEDDPAFTSAKKRLDKEENERELASVGGDVSRLNMLAAEFAASHIQRLLLRQNAHYMATRDSNVRGGVESILFSMVTSSYAAFETLLTDIWLAAVNTHPLPLAYNWLSEHGSKPNARRLKMDFEELAKVGFDASKQMGQFLFDAEGGPSFQKLELIKSNYRNTFGPSVSECFEPFEPIWVASRVRNLVAHKGGIVDRTFLAEVASFPAYATQTAGQHLAMTGDLVRGHVSACVQRALATLQFVDEWMVANAKG